MFQFVGPKPLVYIKIYLIHGDKNKKFIRNDQLILHYCHIPLSYYELIFQRIIWLKEKYEKIFVYPSSSQSIFSG